MADIQPTASVPAAPEPVCVEAHHYVAGVPVTEAEFHAAVRMYARGATDAQVLAWLDRREDAPHG